MSFPVDNIRMLCAMRNTTLAELERALGIGNGVIARWETNKKSPPYDRLVAIADYLGTTVDELSKPDIPAMELQASVLNARLAEETKKAPTEDGEREDVITKHMQSSTKLAILIEMFNQLPEADQNDIIYQLLVKVRDQADPDARK